MKFHVVRHEFFFTDITRAVAEAFECERSDKPDLRADANIWVGYMAYAKWLRTHKGRRTKYDVVMFTHHPGGKAKSWNRAARNAHLCLSMCKKYLDQLPKDRTELWNIGYQSEFDPHRKIRFFVCMNTSKKAQKRKRVDWYQALKKEITNSEWKISGGLSMEQLIECYDWADYLVVLSILEGGPRPVQEAFARCKPVIAPDVGYCWEYPVLRYSGFKEVKAICQKLADSAQSSKSSVDAKAMRLREIVESKLRVHALNRPQCP